MALYRCTVSGSQASGRVWSFRLHYSSASPLATVQADFLAQGNAWWTDGTHGVETLFPATTTLDLVKTESLQVVTIGGVDKIRASGIAFNTAGLVGTGVGDSLPDQNTVLVSLRTPVPGREGRGRFHLPAPIEGIVASGETDATPITRVTTACTALRTGMAGLGHSQVILSYVKSKTGVPVGSFTVVTKEETDRVVRTLRGRVRTRPAVYL